MMTVVVSDSPALPQELIEAILLHLPAAMIATSPLPKCASCDHPREHVQYLSIAQWTWWAYCIVPKLLSTTSLRRAAIKFTDAGDVDAWEPLIALAQRPKKSLPVAHLMEFLVRWYTVVGEDMHLYAAFDCALIHNRGPVLTRWQALAEHGLLPDRTGQYPEPELPLAFALARRAFHAVAWIYENLYLDPAHNDIMDHFALYLCCTNDVDTLRDLVGVFGGFQEFENVVAVDLPMLMVEYATARDASDVLAFLAEQM